MGHHVTTGVSTDPVKTEVADVVLSARVEAAADFDPQVSCGLVKGAHLIDELPLEFRG